MAPLFGFGRKKQEDVVDDAPLLKAQSDALGIEELLHARGCQFKTLRPGWRNEESRNGLIYFLVPAEAQAANFGWFTPDELREWAAGRGVVVKDPMLDELDGIYEYSRVGDKLLEEAGVRVRAKCLAAWVIPESKIPGVRVLVHADDQDWLPDGLYTIEHLQVMLSMEPKVPKSAAAPPTPAHKSVTPTSTPEPVNKEVTWPTL